jgi:Cu(I)/Ag(I) efflux system periplasmic protein CusF
MKTRIIATLSMSLLGVGTGIAADMPGMKMDATATSAAQKAQVNHTVGVVKGLDAAKGTITLSHEPVPAINWPAMTMGFKISKELAATVKPGDKVNFEFTTKGMDGTITKITVMK